MWQAAAATAYPAAKEAYRNGVIINDVMAVKIQRHQHQPYRWQHRKAASMWRNQRRRKPIISESQKAMAKAVSAWRSLWPSSIS